MSRAESGRPDPQLVAWLRTFTAAPTRRRCLVVGCGPGDDAEALASAGFAVTACDIAPAAIAAAERRFPRSGVDYVVADIVDPPPAWTAAFDLIVDIDTLQTLPPERRQAAVRSMVGLLAPGGRVFVLCRACEAPAPAGEGSPALTREELGLFEAEGLRATSVEVGPDDQAPPGQRFRAFFDRLEM